MKECLGVCSVHSGTERAAQHEIERTGFGTRLPSFRVAYSFRGRRYVRLQPLFPGYVFSYLGPGWGQLAVLDGIMVLANNGEPSRLHPRDEERLANLERDCLLGDFNRVQVRSTNGQFAERKRRRKPRRSKRLHRAGNT